MKKTVKVSTLFLISAIAFALFNVLFFVIANEAEALKSEYCGMWTSFAFIEVAFVVCMAAAFFIKAKTSIGATDMIPTFSATIVYLLVTLAVDIILIFASKEKTIAPIVINVIIIAVYAAVFIVTLRIGRQGDAVSAKIATDRVSFKTLSINVYHLSDYTTDPEIKSAITELFKKVGNSSSTSTAATAPVEQQLNDKISEIETALMSGTDKEVVLNLLRQASGLLMKRNQLLATHI